MITTSIRKLKVWCSVGILPHELVSQQEIWVDVEVRQALGDLPGASDGIDDVLDYRFLREAALTEASSGHTNMLETLALRMAQRILAHPRVGSVSVTVTKPSIFVDCDGVSVGVALQREVAA